MSRRLHFAHLALGETDLGIFDIRNDDVRVVDMVFFPETCGWNPVSDTPTLWQTNGAVQIPWRKTPKSVRKLFAGLGSAPKAITIEPVGYAAPPAGEPVHVGTRHVVRCHPIHNNPDTIRRFLARMTRRLGRNRGTITVFSRDLTKHRPPADMVMIGLTYSTMQNPFDGGSLPEGWEPFSSTPSRADPKPEAAASGVLPADSTP